MFDNQYYVIDLNGNEHFVANLEAYIKKIGIRSFSYLFGDQFIKMGWEKYWDLPDSERYDMKFTDANSRYCNCNSILVNKAGKVIPKNQVLSEYIARNPKELDELSRFWRSRHWGTVMYGNKRKYPRGKRTARYANLLRKEKFVSYEFNGSIGSLKTVRANDEGVIRDMRCWYEELPERHNERNWKKYRKQQYKIK